MWALRRQPRRTKRRTSKQYGTGLNGFPELWNPGWRGGSRSASTPKLLEAAESGDPTATRRDAAEELRKTVSTIGRPGEPGAHIRCVVSVNMLSEGWDANNVTHILGLRAFHSQLLCEQVVGRGAASNGLHARPCKRASHPRVRRYLRRSILADSLQGQGTRYESAPPTTARSMRSSHYRRARRSRSGFPWSKVMSLH